MVKIETDIKQIKKTISQLPMAKRLRLLRELERQLWPDKIDQILRNIDQRRRSRKMSAKDINKEIQLARKEFYESRR